MIKAILFDMDGTIIESESFHTGIIQEVLKEELNLDVSVDEIHEYIGLIYPKKLERIFKRRGIDHNIEELTKKILEKYEKFVKGNVKIFPGVKELFESLKKSNYKIGLVSSARRVDVDFTVKNNSLEDCFDVTVAGDEVKNRKPDPECYLKAAGELNLKPEECLVVEDSVSGVIAAKKAGMKCIAIHHDYMRNADFSMANHVVKNTSEVDLNLIKKL